MLNNYVLLITGCIKPDEKVPFLKLKETEVRRKQYIDSIQYYINMPSIKRIVFCDNSSAVEVESLYELAKKKDKQFEWISFLGNTVESIKRGKGYGEGEIIEYALKKSKLIKESDYIIKVTGRIIIKNINFLLKYMHSDKLYFVRNTNINVDTKLYGIPIETYKKYFIDLYKSVDDINNRYLENLFSDAILDNKLKIHSFIVYPNVEGISGSTGKSYSYPLSKRVKLTIMDYLRKM